MYLVLVVVLFEEFLQEGENLVSNIIFYCSGFELGRRMDEKGIFGCLEDGKRKLFYMV